MWETLSEAKIMILTEQYFEDLIAECKHSPLGTGLSFPLRHSIEKFPREVRAKIVNRSKDSCTPLFLAAKRGHTDIVEYLITVCNANVEKKSVYEVPEERSVHYVSPLWCAAVSGKLPVVECLLHYGADVNSMSDTGSTPVRSACFMTHVDVVHYLVKYGADINRPNYNGGTCLINSVQSVVLCKFLIEHGAVVNAYDIQSKTALHYAIQEHRLETTQLLIQHGADYNAKSRYGDDALQTACLKGSVQIFNYLTEVISYPKETLVNAHELLGAICFDEHSDSVKAHHHWNAALSLRQSEPVLFPKTPVMPLRSAFRYQKEFSTVEELESMMLDLDLIRIQSLIVMERVLGPYHKDAIHRLMCRGAAYVDTWRFQRCIDLWQRALEIRIEKDSILYSDTCLTAQALVRLLVDFNVKHKYDFPERSVEERFEDVITVYHLLMKDIKEARKLAIIKPSHRRQTEAFDRILKCITHLIYLMIQIANTDVKKAFIHRLIVDLSKNNIRSVVNEDSLLHLCVSKSNILRSNYFIDEEPIAIFPQLDVIKLLLDCGFDVNSRNSTNSTPLHVATSYNYNPWLIKLLLHYGGHIDALNCLGERPADILTINPLHGVYILDYISLKCLCATVIRKYKIQYKNEVPKFLEDLIQQH
ncbi:hypothetical protein FQA39_LY08644 [Lamprigera yunnana]|nr:hypothetical protein FQA39_LY08644 [Lamprigera yunnana]